MTNLNMTDETNVLTAEVPGTQEPRQPVAPAPLEPVIRYDWTRLPSELPGVLAVKLRTLLHHRAVASVLQAPREHDSQRRLFSDACRMLGAGMHRAEVDYVLRFVFQQYYRPCEEREFERAIENAATHIANGEPAGPRWPKPNPTLIAEVTAAAPGALERLKASSPTLNPDRLTSGAVLARIFPGDPLLCLATDKSRARTEPRSFFAEDEENHPFIVPNVMSCRYGQTQDGRKSVRCLTNTGPRQHVVVEHDTGTLDEQAAILQHLAQHAPLRMVVFSGRKSLHGWFTTTGATDDDVTRFMVYAAALGADPATFNKCQLVRTPNAWRNGGDVKQDVLWLEPQTT